MEFSSSSSTEMRSAKTSTSTSTTTTTSRSSRSGEAFEYAEPVVGYEYEGIPGYVVPLLLFLLFTIAVVEGLGDVLHL